jgi:hypothetical protein
MCLINLFNSNKNYIPKIFCRVNERIKGSNEKEKDIFDL